MLCPKYVLADWACLVILCLVKEHQGGEAIHPMSPLRTTWDVLMLGLILVLCVIAPFRIGFNIQSNLVLDIFDSSSDLFLTADIILNFFTGYVENNNTHLEIRKVRNIFRKIVLHCYRSSVIGVSAMSWQHQQTCMFVYTTKLFFLQLFVDGTKDCLISRWPFST